MTVFAKYKQPLLWLMQRLCKNDNIVSSMTSIIRLLFLLFAFGFVYFLTIVVIEMVWTAKSVCSI
jgi:hypothetical protein